MIDKTLINKLTEMANKEKNVKEFKKRLRVKGKVVKKGVTKKGNITITLKEKEDEFKFTVLKSHKESFALAEKLAVGKSVYVIGIPKFRMIICTKLKVLEKGIDMSKPMSVSEYKIVRSIPDKLKANLPSVDELEKELSGSMKKNKRK